VHRTREKRQRCIDESTELNYTFNVYFPLRTHSFLCAACATHKVPHRFTIDFRPTNPLFLRRPIPAAPLFLLLPQIKRDVTRKTFLAEKRHERRSVWATRALPQAQEIYSGSVFYTKTWFFSRHDPAPMSYLLKVYLSRILV
jgi:hypothetical protein